MNWSVNKRRLSNPNKKGYSILKLTDTSGIPISTFLFAFSYQDVKINDELITHLQKIYHTYLKFHYTMEEDEEW